VAEHILQRISVVAGLGYIERLRRIEGGFTTTLAVERENRYFLQAIAVHWNGEKVGYLAPEIARHYYEPILAWTGEPLSCPGRCASTSDHQASGVEVLLDFTSLPVRPID
jgi:hypothetical protein